VSGSESEDLVPHSSSAGPDEDPIATHEEVDFAPADPTDGRELDNWCSRYRDRRAVAQIWAEAIYLAILLGASAFAILEVWQGSPQHWLAVDDARYATFQTYGYAWLAGVVGGTVFAVKWLYHSVARGFWNVDRLSWRIFIPHISGAFSLGFIALITSGIFEILNRDLLRSGPAVVGLGFLLGYFSDFTVGRLYEIASHLFGAPQSHFHTDDERAHSDRKK
jgi:hypothetical protein